MTKNVLVIISIISLFSAISCNGPYDKIGYGVTIHVGAKARPSVNDIKLITNHIKEYTYEVVTTDERDLWIGESYKIILDEKKFEGIEHKYIMFVLEYYLSGQSIDNKKLLKSIEVRIGNSWDGRKPILKNEIDMIADNITNILEKRFGKSNFSVSSRFETPM